MIVRPSCKARLATLAACFLFATSVHAAASDTVVSAVPTLDSAALLADVQTLASPAFAGRRTGSEGSRLARQYIEKRFRETGIAAFGATYSAPFAFTATSKAGKQTEYPAASNVIGNLRGSTTPDRYMVVSAHYDHLGVQGGAAYLGADDNASGVAAMLAIAAHFKKHPPKNTIVFAAFDGEELGHRGAAHFVRSAPFPIVQVALNLNLDMVSRNDNNEIFVAGTRYTPSLKPLIAKAAAASSVTVKLGHDSRRPGMPPDDDWTGQSDHAEFYKLKIPFVYFGVEDHADYHQPGDSFEKIDPAFFAEVARLLVTSAVILDQQLDTVK